MFSVAPFNSFIKGSQHNDHDALIAYSTMRLRRKGLVKRFPCQIERNIYLMIPGLEQGCFKTDLNRYITEVYWDSKQNRTVIEKTSPLNFPIKLRIQYLCSKMAKTKELIKIKAGGPQLILAQRAEFIIIKRFPHFKYFLFPEYFLSLVSNRELRILLFYIPPIIKPVFTAADFLSLVHFKIGNKSLSNLSLLLFLWEKVRKIEAVISPCRQGYHEYSLPPNSILFVNIFVKRELRVSSQRRVMLYISDGRSVEVLK